MEDDRKLCEYEVHGIRHTALLDQADQDRFKARVVENKARKTQTRASDGADSK